MSSLHLPGPIAVIDVETTGLFPSRHDRVIEIAAVVIQDDGRIDREFVSLVNPGRDIGPSSIHGLTSEDILDAPQFREIAALLVEVLNGCVAIAAHNVRFDQQFLHHEFSQIDCQLPEFFSICTMQLAGGGALTKCFDDYGITVEGETHHALMDARGAARLLVELLPDQPQTVLHLNGLMPIQWPTVPQSAGRPITRDESRRRQAEPPKFLQRLLSRISDGELLATTDGAVMPLAASPPASTFVDPRSQADT